MVARSQSSFPVLSIIAIVAGAVALVFCALPWFYVASSALNLTNTINQYASYIAGGSEALPALNENYAPWQFNDMLSVITQYSVIVEQIQEGIATIGLNLPALSDAQSALQTAQSALTVASLGYWVGIIAMAAGIVFMLFTRGRLVFVYLVGCVVLAIIAFGFTFAISSLDYVASGAPANAAICGAFCIIAFVLAIIGKPSRRIMTEN